MDHLANTLLYKILHAIKDSDEALIRDNLTKLCALLIKEASSAPIPASWETPSLWEEVLRFFKSTPDIKNVYEHDIAIISRELLDKEVNPLALVMLVCKLSTHQRATRPF